ncbi:hypothetical protein SLEP1_g31618 [Rubroshorea leprosula]|uniref:NAC domain-containing protein n=1 Tax=Rubroshorea leprosula TaxID=152421 RepID=A0AAV5K904_9ROSI|nr:hypothetical protein SLEP1_g31618 [Rubroshorea leprosula]
MGKMSLPPGFRFYPTDVELIKYYLKRKVMGKKICFESIAELDIYKHAPWDLPDKSCLRTGDLKWYFFCPVEKKYRRGARSNRATESGYWKTTGKDRPVLYYQEVAGMIKTLVFHTGKAPKGERTDWVMHEYKLEDKDLAEKGVAQDTYVLCVIFKKDGPGPRNGAQYGAPFREEDWIDDECDSDHVVYSAALPTPAYVDPIHLVGSVATTSSVPKGLLSTPASVDAVDQVSSLVTSLSAPENLLSTPANVDPMHLVDSVTTTSSVPKNLLPATTSVDVVHQVGSFVTSPSAPENLLSTPANVGPMHLVGSVTTTSSVPQNLLSTPTSIDDVYQVGSFVTSPSAPENLLSAPASADPIDQVDYTASTSCVPKNPFLELPSAYKVSPAAPTVNNALMSMEDTWIPGDNMEALLAMLSEDFSLEPMVHGPFNHVEASSSPGLSIPVNHVNYVASSPYAAENPVSTADILCPSASNVPSMDPGANNGSTLMNVPSPLASADDDMESLLANFYEDGTFSCVPYPFMM